MLRRWIGSFDLAACIETADVLMLVITLVVAEEGVMAGDVLILVCELLAE